MTSLAEMHAGIMSVAAALAHLGAIADGVSGSLQVTRDAIPNLSSARGGDGSPRDPRGGDTPGGRSAGGHGGHEDPLRVARVADAIGRRGGAINALAHGLHAGLETHADEIKKAIADHAKESVNAIDSAARDAVPTILGAFDKRDKTLIELLNYVTTRAGGEITGTAALSQIVNDLKALKSAFASGNATSIKTLMDRLRGVIDFINKFMLGPTGAQLDLNRLISEFLGGLAAPGSYGPYQVPTQHTNGFGAAGPPLGTGEVSAAVSTGAIKGGF